jgi:hypothetical protein
MYARLQTWFPVNIQIGFNGRDGLARQMHQDGLEYLQQGAVVCGSRIMSTPKS